MRNVLDKIRRENQHTHFMFTNFFSENRTDYKTMSKNMKEGPQMTTEHGAYALRAGLARLHARMRTHTPTRPGTRTHARTRKHAHTEEYVTHCLSTATMVS